MSRKEKRVFFNSNLCKIQRRGPCITAKPLPPIKPTSIDNYFVAPRVEPFYHFLMKIVSGTPATNFCVQNTLALSFASSRMQ